MHAAELRRRLGQGPLDSTTSSPSSPSSPSSSTTIKPRRRLDLLLLGRAGGILAPRTPSRLEVMASVGCCRLPDALTGSLDQFPAPLFSAVFSRSGSTVAVACQDETISLFDTDQLLQHQAAAATVAAAEARLKQPSSLPAPPPPRPRKEIQCQVSRIWMGFSK